MCVCVCVRAGARVCVCACVIMLSVYVIILWAYITILGVECLSAVVCSLLAILYCPFLFLFRAECHDFVVVVDNVKRPELVILYRVSRYIMK